MKKCSLLMQSCKQALGVTAYILLVSLLMNYGEQIFGTAKTLLGPIAFLLLFVVSAAVTGYLVVGKSILMYIDGAKKEAVKLFGMTLMWLLLFMMMALLGLVVR